MKAKDSELTDSILAVKSFLGVSQHFAKHDTNTADRPWLLRHLIIGRLKSVCLRLGIRKDVTSRVAVELDI